MPNRPEALRHLAKARELVEAALDKSWAPPLRAALHEALTQVDLAEQELVEEEELEEIEEGPA